MTSHNARFANDVSGHEPVLRAHDELWSAPRSPSQCLSPRQVYLIGLSTIVTLL